MIRFEMEGHDDLQTLLVTPAMEADNEPAA